MVVCGNAIEISKMQTSEIVTMVLPQMIMWIYLNLLLIMWKLRPIMRYATKRGTGRKEYTLYSLKQLAK